MATVLAIIGGTALSLTGCSGLREDICASGEYPVAAVRNTGSMCVENGQAPPTGYVPYPAGKVPKHVDDKWDLYWREHVLDENGREVPA